MHNLCPTPRNGKGKGEKPNKEDKNEKIITGGGTKSQYRTLFNSEKKRNGRKGAVKARTGLGDGRIDFWGENPGKKKSATSIGKKGQKNPGVGQVKWPREGSTPRREL